MENLNCISNKNRKNAQSKVKKHIKNDNICQKYCDFDKSGVTLFAWVKTLVSVHDAIPNIIKLVDKIIATKASSVVDGSSIFGDYKHGTYNQIEQVLDFQQRKLSLVNLYTIIETMVASVPKKYLEFIKLKFYKHKTMQYVSEELGIDERTAFRWSHIVLNKMVEFCEKNNWTVLFFNSQTSDEAWLKEHFHKNYKKLVQCNKA